MSFWPVVLLAGIIAILFAAWLARDVLSQDRGTKAMQEVASLIFEGAMAFLRRQYGKTYVAVRFDNHGRTVKLNFILANGPEGWLILDVESPHDSLRLFLEQFRN